MAPRPGAGAGGDSPGAARFAAGKRSPLAARGFDAGRAARLAVLGAVLVLGACEREQRRFREAAPAAAPAATVRLVATSAGVVPETDYAFYERNAWAIAEGQRLYHWFNCAGCHAPGGGGAMGPPLIDEEWIYGGAPGAIFETIQQGRPNGMPAFGARLSAADTWKLVAFVRSLSARTPPDTWPGRVEGMEEANPEPERGEPDEAGEAAAERRRRDQR